MSPAAIRQMRFQVASHRQTALGLSRQRLVIGVGLFGVVVAIFALRLIDLTVLDERVRATNVNLLAGLTPERADIIDRNGASLARSFEAYAIAIRPQDVVGDRQLIAQQLAAALPGMTPEKAASILNSNHKFSYVQRRVLPSDAKRINAIGEPAIILQRERERLYPNLDLAAHVIGYTDVDGKGASGIEGAFEERLSRTDMRGKPLQLAMDSRVQMALESELGNAMTKFSAIGAAGVVLDANTGEILAMVSLPQFNPNNAGRGDDNQRFNRATLGVYELGSTFKAFTMAMAIEAGVITGWDQLWDCTHDLKVARFSIRDTHPLHKMATVPEIFKESSNIGTAQIARSLGSARQQEFLKGLGFMEPVSVELKAKGRVLNPGANWGDIATMTVGYGHGISVTPLHLASGYAALVNGGIWRPATVLKVGAHHPVPSGRRVFSEATSAKARELLRLVVLDGTGKKAAAPGYRVGGKTGTAEKVVGGRYSRGSVVTNFAGVFPMDNPRYVVVAMLDEPKGTKDSYGFKTAGWNVAPVVGRVIERIAPALGVIPDEALDAEISPLMPYIHEGKPAE
jgi:cell division protein FtsI (penicillin-binding protein 3)